ncbi:DUF4228 domain protein [Wolffia australiana]
MGNAVSPCLLPFAKRSSASVKLIFWGGHVRLLRRSQPAGELLFEFPDHVICPADAFFIGRHVTTLSLDDVLVAGRSYFVIPVDRVPQRALTPASIAALSPAPRSRGGVTGLVGENSPFEYLNDAEEGLLIRVKPEFMEKVMGQREEGGGSSPLCTTPELQKHYQQLVGPRDQPWSPKLETIAERKARLSPSRILGFDVGR